MLGYLLHCILLCICFFFFMQKTAYEMRISDWSSDVCSSDLRASAFCATVWMPCSALIFARCSAPGSLARMASAATPLARSPPIRLAAMLPAPMKAMRGEVIAIPLLRASVVAGAEQCGADADPGRAFGNCRFEVLDHAHGQRIQFQWQFIAQCAQAGKGGALLGGVFARCGNAHPSPPANERQERRSAGAG